MDEDRLRIFENNVLMRVFGFGSTRQKLTGCWRIINLKSFII
jgi:hypothetical protein